MEPYYPTPRSRSWPVGGTNLPDTEEQEVASMSPNLPDTEEKELAMGTLTYLALKSWSCPIGFPDLHENEEQELPNRES